jgi:hypothetical protein
VLEYQERITAEQATGCVGAGDYRQWAAEQGYPILYVVDWTSSAGDWTFLVSIDGDEWFPMFQENNYPLPGFTRTIDKDHPYYGTSEEALQDFVYAQF